jgi:WD40 repeat protein
VIRTPSGHLYLIDFGIARRFVPGKHKDTMPLGSPGYAAPEQYGRSQTTPRSDIYSLGILLHQLLTGSDPSESLFQLTRTCMYGNTGFTDLEALIMEMAEKEEHKRPDSIREVRQELERIVLRHTEAYSPIRQKLQSGLFPSEQSAVLPGSMRAQQQQMSVPPTPIAAQQQVSGQQKSRNRRSVLIGLGAGSLLLLGAAWSGDVLFPHPTNRLASRSSTTKVSTARSVVDALPKDKHRLSVFRGHSGFVNAVQWSPSGKYLASQDTKKGVCIWDVNNQKKSGSFSMPLASYFTGMGWLPGSKQIAIEFAMTTVSGGQARTCIFDVQKESVVSIYDDIFYPSRVAWSPDGRLKAGGENSKSMVIYHADYYTGYAMHSYVADGDAMNLVYSESEYILALSWSPDNKYIASGDNLGFVRVWEVASGKITRVYRYVHTFVSALSWSPNGKYIACAYDTNSQLLIWNVLTGKPAYHYASPYTFISALVWSPDSKRIALAGEGAGHTVEVWDVTTRGNIFTYRGHADDALSLSWSPDGRYIASGGKDTTVQIWQSG